MPSFYLEETIYWIFLDLKFKIYWILAVNNNEYSFFPFPVSIFHHPKFLFPPCPALPSSLWLSLLSFTLFHSLSDPLLCPTQMSCTKIKITSCDEAWNTEKKWAWLWHSFLSIYGDGIDYSVGGFICIFLLTKILTEIRQRRTRKKEKTRKRCKLLKENRNAAIGTIYQFINPWKKNYLGNQKKLNG